MAEAKTDLEKRIESAIAETHGVFSSSEAGMRAGLKRIRETLQAAQDRIRELETKPPESTPDTNTP